MKTKHRTYGTDEAGNTYAKIVWRGAMLPPTDLVDMLAHAFKKSLSIPVYGSATTESQLRRIQKRIAKADMSVAFYPDERAPKMEDFLFVKARHVWQRVFASRTGRIDNLTALGVQCEDRAHALKLKLLIDDKIDEYMAAHDAEHFSVTH